MAKLNEIGAKLAARPAMPAPATVAVAEREPTLTADDGVLDFTAIDALRDSIGSEFGELFQALLTSVADGISAIDGLLQAGDLPGVSREAHNLVGTAGSVGAAKVCDLARGMEHASKSCDGEECLYVLVELRGAFAQARRPLREYAASAATRPQARASQSCAA